MEAASDWEEEEMEETEAANLQEMPERTREEARAFDVFFDQVVHEKRAEGAAFHLGRLKEAGEQLAVIRRRTFSGGEGEDRRRKFQAATLSRLEDQLIQERDRSTQSKRFAFRRKKVEKSLPSTQTAGAGAACAMAEATRTKAAPELSRGAETSQLKETGGQREEEGEEDPCGSHTVYLENRKNEVIVFRPGELRGRELILRDLDQCLLVVAEKIPAARVRRLTACLVFFADISSSLWLFGCRKSLFCLQCQQLRVHDSRDVAFLLRIFSSPIIERTTGAVFGPQLLQLRLPPSVAAEGEESSRNTEAAGETSGSRNHEAERCDAAPLWQDVKDFDWIKKQASPHWTTVPLRPPFDFPLAPLTLQSLETEENVNLYAFLCLPLCLSLEQRYRCLWPGALRFGRDFFGAQRAGVVQC
ncbi:tubulin-binding cofactor C [Toxoplasma gondii RUB]|uniref:Tubulin-binding cofactor C n=10 Tax=Toxoplasma gondii TaxID=5811 RepID=A0A086LNP5_TOXGO|nr:tubulin-binding cofactor C [Toxoplasma gondii RUB]